MSESKDRSQAAGVRLSWGERLAYGASGAGTIIPIGIIGSMLTIYLTNVVHLDVAIVSSIIAASILLDGMSDLIAGNVIDRTNTRMGKARPWVIGMALPIAISTFLLFRVPKDISKNSQYIYVFVLYVLCVTCFCTLGSIAKLSMVSLLSSDGKEQTLLGNVRAIGETIGMMVVTIFFVQLLPVFSSEEGNPETQSAYSGTLAVFCSVALIFMLMAGSFTRERVSMSEQKKHVTEKMGLLKTAKALLHNKYWVMLFLFDFILFTGFQMNMASGAYFATYVLGDLGKMSLLMTSIQVSSFLTMFMVPALIGRFEKRKIYIIGLLLTAIGYVGIGLFATTLSALTVFCVLLGFGRGVVFSVEPGLIADVIRLTRYRTGMLSAGLGSSGIMTASKLGMAISSLIMGFVMSLAGFSEANEAQNLPQPAAVSTAVTWLYAYGPALLCIIILVFFIPLFHLEKELKEFE